MKDHIERSKQSKSYVYQKLVATMIDANINRYMEMPSVFFDGDPKTLRRAPEGDPVAPKRTAQALHDVFFFSEESLNVIYYDF